MGRPSKRHDEIVRIARMHYEDRLPQKDVATRLGISESTVSRALRQALDLGYVEIRVVAHALRDRSLEADVIARFGLQGAVVTETRRSDDDTLRVLGDALATYLARILSEGMTIGTSDGRTLAAVAEGLRNAPRCRVRVLPLLGTIGAPQLPTHPAEIARTMARYLGGEAWSLPIPAVADDLESARILARASSTQAVFAMMSSLDVALVGLGALDDETPILQHGVVTRDQIHMAVRNGAVGAICARFFDASGRAVRTALDDQTMAVTLDQFARCPRRILAATGAVKADAMRAALTNQIVNVVGTDVRTAKMLLTG